LAPDVIVAYGREQIIDTAGEVLPERTTCSNLEFRRVSHETGLRRDLLVCAFWQQISHVGFLVLAEAARKVGVRSRSQVGLAVDADFAIRLAQAHRGSAHVFIDRATVQSRVGPSTLSQMSHDVAWRFYDLVCGMDGLSLEEAQARDVLLSRIQPLALREHSLAHGPFAALRIFLSRPYRSSGGLSRWAYSLGLIVMPDLAYSMRRLAKSKFSEGRLPSAAWRREQPLPVADHL